MRLLILSFLCILMLIGCAGNDSTEVDTTPPGKPILLPHGNDIGDLVDDTYYNKEDNGIDAVSGEDWIRLSWEPFDDSDLEKIKIFRYRKDSAGITDLTEIDEIDSEESSYMDMFSQLTSSIEVQWFYYIELFDEAENSTLSDTVSYKLARKVTLGDEEIVGNQVTFKWTANSVNEHRLLIWFEDHVALFVSKTLYQDQDEVNGQLEYTVDDIPNGKYYWRVDCYGLADIEGNRTYGSESVERSFEITD